MQIPTPPNTIECLAEEHGRDWQVFNADCVDVACQLPDNSIDFSVYSPPFANLYIYSDSAADMGNNEGDDEFFTQYKFLIEQMHRITRPGRISAVHCKNLVNYRGRDGMAGLRDFRGEIIKAHCDAGWAYHSEVVIWKDPVIEMQRTKAHGLLYKQLRADSTFSRQGMPEYVLVFRKWANTESDADLVQPVEHTHKSFTLDQWQQWASPVWMDIWQTLVLNIESAREDKDEKHICPLQLDVIERCLVLWSRPNDVVFSPFMGIGSEGYQCLNVGGGRRFIGTELKESYYKQAVAYLKKAASQQNLPL